MSLQGILLYTARALRFAIIVELVWLFYYGILSGGWRGLQNGLQRKQFFWSSLLVFYLAALLQITVIRGGVGLASVLGRPMMAARYSWCPCGTPYSKPKGVGGPLFIQSAGM